MHARSAAREMSRDSVPAVGLDAYLPLRGDWYDSPFAVGGTPEGMARAQAKAWPQIIEFLSDATKPALAR
jgi:hypothetical protein